MKYPLTIVYSTGRPETKIEWFFESLKAQCGDSKVEIVIVDSFAASRTLSTDLFPCRHVLPKPTVWQLDHRLTKQDWWAVSNSRNTGLCLAQTPWVAVLDDRSVLGPQWCEAVDLAMQGNYVVAGAYEKATNVVVDGGKIVSFKESLDPNGTGRPNGKDSRLLHVTANKLGNPFDAPGEWFFGCSSAMPLNWILNIGGWDETCDGLSMEDVIAGLMLQNSGYPIKYDTRMMLLEDRTPGTLGPAFKREDKGVSPNDKSHALLAMLKDRKTAMHGFDIREVRRKVLAGEPWPKPWGPTHDFYDGQPVSEMI